VDGIIVVNKPEGFSSHQVVYEIRKIFPGIKAGHSGTLDPMATGVLPVCLGKATRIVEYLIELPKVYRAAVVFGKTTDTEDATGTVIEEAAVPCLKRKEIESVLKKFIGKIEQTAPLYSAVKHRGKPFYYWTRRGESVPQRIRSAEIYSINLLEYNCEQEPHLVFEVNCSKGTYIRTLAADIGKTIGCGAHLSSLIRNSVGPYKLEQALSLEEVATKAMQGLYKEFLLGMDTALAHFEKLRLADWQIKALKNGQIVIPEKQDLLEQITGKTPISIYNDQGIFKAIAGRVKNEDGVGLKTIKYLAE
jgi:tRNA pseudouridine55 synthase